MYCNRYYSGVFRSFCELKSFGGNGIKQSAIVSVFLFSLITLGCVFVFLSGTNGDSKTYAKEPTTCANKNEYVQVGSVAVRVNNYGFDNDGLAKCELEIKISDQCFKYSYHLGTILSYAFILRTHCPVFDAFDGIPTPGRDLLPLPEDLSLTSKNLPRFKFFSDKPDTIGFMIGTAGASGGSSQRMIFLDTETGTLCVINCIDLYPPFWIDECTPPSYAETTTGFYLGPHALSLGCSPRISKVYVFCGGSYNGLCYELDRQKLLQLCQDKFDSLIFTTDDINELQKNDLFEIDRDLGERFLDYVYYGAKSGNVNAVNNLLHRVSPEVRKETLNILRYITLPFVYVPKLDFKDETVSP